MITKQSMVRQKRVRIAIADSFRIDTINIKFFTMVRIKDCFPRKWNGRTPIVYKIARQFFFIARRKIDDRFLNKWNGCSPIGKK